MGLLNLLPKEEQYFSLFSQMTSQISKAAGVLVELLNDKSGDLTGYVARVETIGHSCDELTHGIVKRLNQTFITPLDREDIYSLTGALDDIVDLIDDAARTMLMYDLRAGTDYARCFADVVRRMAAEIHEVASTLGRPAGVTTRLVEIHRLENEGDRIYHKVIQRAMIIIAVSVG